MKKPKDYLENCEYISQDGDTVYIDEEALEACMEDYANQRVIEEFELAKKEEDQEDDVWYNQESKKASLENLNATNKAFEASIEDHLDKERSDTQITPQALVDLGFKENYQGINCGDAGFLYYDLEVKGVAFLSTSLGEDEPLHVMLGYEGRPPIHNLAKLKELIRILTLID